MTYTHTHTHTHTHAIIIKSEIFCVCVCAFVHSKWNLWNCTQQWPHVSTYLQHFRCTRICRIAGNHSSLFFVYVPHTCTHSYAAHTHMLAEHKQTQTLKTEKVQFHRGCWRSANFSRVCVCVFVRAVRTQCNMLIHAAIAPTTLPPFASHFLCIHLYVHNRSACVGSIRVVRNLLAHWSMQFGLNSLDLYYNKIMVIFKSHICIKRIWYIQG